MPHRRGQIRIVKHHTANCGAAGDRYVAIQQALNDTESASLDRSRSGIGLIRTKRQSAAPSLGETPRTGDHTVDRRATAIEYQRSVVYDAAEPQCSRTAGDAYLQHAAADRRVSRVSIVAGQGDVAPRDQVARSGQCAGHGQGVSAAQTIAGPGRSQHAAIRASTHGPQVEARIASHVDRFRTVSGQGDGACGACDNLAAIQPAHHGAVRARNIQEARIIDRDAARAGKRVGTEMKMSAIDRRAGTVSVGTGQGQSTGAGLGEAPSRAAQHAGERH